jgi:hypothetical protein
VKIFNKSNFAKIFEKIDRPHPRSNKFYTFSHPPVGQRVVPLEPEMDGESQNPDGLLPQRSKSGTGALKVKSAFFGT